MATTSTATKVVAIEVENKAALVLGTSKAKAMLERDESVRSAVRGYVTARGVVKSAEQTMKACADTLRAAVEAESAKRGERVLLVEDDSSTLVEFVVVTKKAVDTDSMTKAQRKIYNALLEQKAALEAQIAVLEKAHIVRVESGTSIKVAG